MRPIEGINLSDELTEVHKERLVAQAIDVRKAINSIYTQIAFCQREEAQAKNQAAKAADKLAKAQAKLQQLKEGNWAVLDEEKMPQTEEGNNK